MVGIFVAIVGLPLVGSVPIVACAVVVVPLAGIHVIIDGKGIGPLPLTPPKKGSRFVPAMGLDGAVNRLGSEW